MKLPLMSAALCCGLVLACAVPMQGQAAGSNEDFTADAPPSADYQKAVDAIHKGKFADAKPILQKVVAGDASNADAWNYLGYSDRMLGNFQDSLADYQKALALKPEHRGATEYLGELYVQTGDLPKARLQLAKLEHICGGTSCDEYSDLKDMIDGKKKAGW